ncbi:MAG: hypothetical protein WAR24_08680, partial [Candidatus Acidiferrales bacterium]
LLTRLCSTYQDRISGDFREWRIVPEDIRNDAAALQNYADGLIAVATFFADELGRPELLASLSGSQGENPLVKWQNTLAQAQESMDRLLYRPAAKSLEAALAEFEGLHGTGRDACLPLRTDSSRNVTFTAARFKSLFSRQPLRCVSALSKKTLMAS